MKILYCLMLFSVCFVSADITYVNELYTKSCRYDSNDIICIGAGDPLLAENILSAKDTLYFFDYSINDRTLSSKHIEGFSEAKSFTLRKVNIEKIESFTFEAFSSLKSLDLSENYIAEIRNDTFSGLEQLESLNLAHNKIENVKTILLQVNNLKTLILSFNFITKLNSDIFIPPTLSHNIENLILDSNKIESIDEIALLTLPNLQKLVLSNNPMTNIDSLHHSQHYRYLDLELINSGFIKSPVIYSGHLFRVSMSYNNITEIKLGRMNSETRIFILDNNDIDFVEKRAFLFSSSLLKLSINNNKLTFIPAMPESTDSLSLNNNYIKDIPDYTFEKNINLNTLSLRNNLIKKLNKCSFCGLMRLAKLDLSRNNIDTLDQGMFVQLISMKYLNLSGNPIEIIASGTFIGLNRLELLDLSYLRLNIEYENIFYGLSNLETLVMKNSPHLSSRILNSPNDLNYLNNLGSLDLSNNDLTTLNPSITNMNLKIIHLVANKLNCDNSNRWIASWINSTDFTATNYDAICSTTENSKKTVMSLSRSDVLEEVSILRLNFKTIGTLIGFSLLYFVILIILFILTVFIAIRCFSVYRIPNMDVLNESCDQEGDEKSILEK